MGIGAIYYALKAAEELSREQVLKRKLYTVISFIVFTSTIVHGVTVPTFLLASSVHPVWHPKNLIRTGGDGGEDDGELPEMTEQTTLLRPFVWLARKYGTNTGADDMLDGECGNDDNGHPRAMMRKTSSTDPDEGEPITRAELHRILNDLANDEEDEDRQYTTKRDGQGRLTKRQKEALLTAGSGLEHWEHDKEILVYDEGNVLIVTDNEGELVLFSPFVVQCSCCNPGNVSTRRIYQSKRR
jgi:hypothetical protein